MGDMNDDPMDESLHADFGARKYISGMKANQFFNPWWKYWRIRCGNLALSGQVESVRPDCTVQTVGESEKGLRYDHSEVLSATT